METIIQSTHPVQLFAIASMAISDVVGLYLINKHKKLYPEAPKLAWTTRRNAFWTLIFLVVASACYLDTKFYIEPKIMLPLKSYTLAFSLGLLDLYFSETRGVPMKVLLGAILWCSTNIMRKIFLDIYFGCPVQSLVVIQEFSLSTVPKEMIRYVAMLVGTGIFSDLIFSPMHRLSHRYGYKYNHKEHHEYTNKLTALVLYHGTLLDDFLMPFTTTIGGMLYVLAANQFGFMAESFSNVTAYLVIFNTVLSHAHDIRCSRLLAPLPDELNFVAYHYVHHLSPANNFGLTEPSDKFWDYVLGVNTIAKLDDLVLKTPKKIK